MRMTRFIFITTFLLTVNRAFGLFVVLDVDVTNINTMPFAVRAERTNNDKDILFRVIVARHLPDQAGGEAMKFSFESATLAAYDGTNFISSGSVTGKSVPSDMQGVGSDLAKEGIMFEFVVSTNHLTSSILDVSYVSGRHPEIADYRFRLKTFIHGK